MKNRIRAEMVKAGLRNPELAELLGISTQSLSMKLNAHAQFTAAELLQMSYLFKTSTDYILKGGEQDVAGSGTSDC